MDPSLDCDAYDSPLAYALWRLRRTIGLHTVTS